MRENTEERACELTSYIIENKSTVRATAKKFGVSKFKVHEDMNEKLYYANRAHITRSKICQNMTNRNAKLGLVL